MRSVPIYYQDKVYTFKVHESGEFISDIIASHKNFFELDTLEFCHQNFDLSYVLDVGANIGNHASFFEKVCGSKVIAVEPHPDNFTLLQENTQKSFNLNMALAEATKQTWLVDIFECRGNSSLINSNNSISIGDTCHLGKVSDLIPVQTIPLDILGLKGLTFIKLDVEGSELNVLQGAIKTLKSFSGVIMIEIHEESAFKVLNGGRYSRKELFLFLIDLGFRCIYKDRYSNYFFQK